MPLSLEPVHCCEPLDRGARPRCARSPAERDIALEQRPPRRAVELRARRPPAPEAGPAQPAHQRRQVQPARRHGARHAAARAGPACCAIASPTPGCGIAPRQLERALPPVRAPRRRHDRASRAPASAWRSRSGLIEAMGGTIGVESSAGRGLARSTSSCRSPTARIERASATLSSRSAAPSRSASSAAADGPLHRGQPRQPRARPARLRALGGLELMSAMQGQMGIELAAPARARPRSCSTSTCPTSTARRCCGACAATSGCATSR